MQFQYPMSLLLVRAIAFTLAPIYMLCMVIWAIVQDRLIWWALLFWIFLTSAFFWHGIACCGEFRRRWREPSSRT